MRLTQNFPDMLDSFQGLFLLDPVMGVVGFEEATTREPAPGWDVFVGTQVLGGEFEDLARSKGLKPHPEHDDNLTAAHVSGVPVVGYCYVFSCVHSPEGSRPSRGLMQSVIARIK